MRTCISTVGLWVTASLAIAQTTTGTGTPTLKVTPSTLQIRAGAKPTTQTFSVSEVAVAHPSTTFTWTLSGAANVTGSLGTIDSKGVYTPPVTPPTPNTVTVTAADTTNNLKGSATITVLDPAPVISSLTPANINTG